MPTHVAGAKPGLRDDRVVRREERLGHGRSLFVVEPLGHCNDVALVYGDAIGEPAAADEAEHTVADLPAQHLVAACNHLARHLQPWYVLRSAGRRRIVAATLRLPDEELAELGIPLAQTEFVGRSWAEHLRAGRGSGRQFLLDRLEYTPEVVRVHGPLTDEPRPLIDATRGA
jgi:hypothetical protein